MYITLQIDVLYIVYYIKRAIYLKIFHNSTKEINNAVNVYTCKCQLRFVHWSIKVYIQHNNMKNSTSKMWMLLLLQLKPFIKTLTQSIVLIQSTLKRRGKRATTKFMQEAPKKMGCLKGREISPKNHKQWWRELNGNCKSYSTTDTEEKLCAKIFFGARPCLIFNSCVCRYASPPPLHW